MQLRQAVLEISSRELWRIRDRLKERLEADMRDQRKDAKTAKMEGMEHDPYRD